MAATNCSAEVAKVNVEACQLLPEDQSVSRGGKAPYCDVLTLVQELYEDESTRVVYHHYMLFKI